MDICGKRCIGFIIFSFFGILCTGFSFLLSGYNNDTRARDCTLILYGILLLTSIRYNQFINVFHRWFSAFLIVVCYLLYWVLLGILYSELNNAKIFLFLMEMCSIVTVICDMWTISLYKETDKLENDIELPTRQ